jgi:hypothetical protein
MYCFYLFLVLLISGHYRLEVSLFEKIQDYEDKTLSSNKWEARQVTLAMLILYVLFLSLVYILAYML